jgi:uridine kinase
MTQRVHTVEDLALIVDERRSQRPFVVAIAGRGGSGKSTLAHQLAMRLVDSAVVPLDDFLVKASLLAPRVEDHFDLLRVEREVLISFTQGLPFNYRRLDWDSGMLVPIDGVIDSTLIVLEGICAFEPPLESYVDLSVWVDTPANVATARGRDRDEGSENVDHWEAWERQDTDFLARCQPERRADVVISGS